MPAFTDPIANTSQGSAIARQPQVTYLMIYPAAFAVRSIGAYVRPLNVLSKAKLVRAATRTRHLVSSNRAAGTAIASGRNGDSPAASESALRNCSMPTAGKNSRAKVVLPAPFGPPMA